MEIYLLRHGIAVEPGSSGFHKDSERPLTQEGEDKMAEIAAAMKKLDLGWDLILSSPFVRTRQTAEIVANKLDLKKKLKFSEHLASGENPKKICEEILREYAGMERILLVGHEPYLSGLLSVLLTGNLNAAILMKKGSCCKLSLKTLRYAQCATLEWLLTPKQMIAMVQD